MIEFTPSSNAIYLHFQCSTDMTVGQMCDDINEYISTHKNELYIDKTDVPMYFKRFKIIRDASVWDK